MTKLAIAVFTTATYLAFGSGAAGKASDPQASPGPTASATPERSYIPPGMKIRVSGEDSAITSLLRSQFIAWQSGTVDPSPYSAKGADALKIDVPKYSADLKKAGSVQTIQFLAKGIAHGGNVDGDATYLYELTCDQGIVHVNVLMSADGKIDKLLFKGP